MLYLDAAVAATIVHVHEEGRRVEVLTEEGTQLEFALNPATGWFLHAEDPAGPRLRLLG